MEIPFIGGAYSEWSLNANAQRCVNLFPKLDQQSAKNAVTLSGTPGLVEFSDVPTARYAVLFENLVSYYKFDETSGLVVADDKGTFTGTLVGFVDDDSQWVPGKINNGVYFAGTPEYGTTNETYLSLFQSNYSISLFVKLDDGIPSALQYLVGSKDQPGAYYTQTHISINTAGNISAYYGNQTGGVNFTTLNPPFSNGLMSSYAHIVATFEQNGSDFQALLYINGVIPTPNATLDGSGTGISMSSWNSTKDFYFGTWNDRGTPGSRLVGSLDELGFFSEALTQSQVSKLYAYYS